VYLRNGGAFQSRDLTIENNHIRIGNNGAAQTGSAIGIYLQDVWFANVRNNIIERHAGSVTQIAIGIYLDDVNNTNVCDNKTNLLGGGVYHTGHSYDVDISNNKFFAHFHFGAWAVINSFPVLNSSYGLEMNGNSCCIFTKGLTGGICTSSALEGLVIETDLTAANATLANVSISDNIVAGLSSAGPVRGIRLEVDVSALTTARGFKIDGNQVSALVSTGSSNRGIYITGTNGGGYLQNLTLNSNRVFMTVDSVTARIAAVDAEHSMSSVTMNGNTLVLISANASSYGNALYVGTTPAVGALNSSSDIVISGNVLVGALVGLYLRCGMRVQVSDNTVYSKGVGMYFCYPRRTTHVVGNCVTVASVNGNPYSGSGGGGGGSSCITMSSTVSGTTSDGINLASNVLYLMAEGAPADVINGSACLNIQDVNFASVDNNTMRCHATTVGGGAPGSNAYLFRLRVAGVAGGVLNHYSITNNKFNDLPAADLMGNTRGVVHGLYIYADASYDGDFDKCTGHVGNNTFLTSQAGSAVGYTFNKDGNTPAPPGTSMSGPYALFVSDNFVDPTAALQPKFFFVGNEVTPAISSFSGSNDIPVVYLRRLFCVYESGVLTNHCTSNGGGGTAGSWQ